MAKYIKAPSGGGVTASSGGISVTVDLKLSPNLEIRLNNCISNAQQWLDKTVLEDSGQYVPVNTGSLRRSGVVAGSGEIRYTASYAREQYYSVKNHNKAYNPIATREWFVAAKAANREKWINGVRNIVLGGGA